MREELISLTDAIFTMLKTRQLKLLVILLTLWLISEKLTPIWRAAQSLESSSRRLVRRAFNSEKNALEHCLRYPLPIPDSRSR